MIIEFSTYTEGLDTLINKMEKSRNETELALAEEVRKDTDPFVPARTMSQAIRSKTETIPPLSKRAKEETDAARRRGQALVVYPGPYARYLYGGILYVDPDTGSAWAKKGKTKVATKKTLDIKTSTHKQATSHWFEASKAQNLEKWKKFAAKVITHDFEK